MRAAAKPRTAGTTAAILTLALCAAATSPGFAPAAFAQTTGGAAPLPETQVTQVQLGDVFAGQTLNVTMGDPVVAQATAAGNTVSAIAGEPGQNYIGVQTLGANVGAGVQASVTQGAGSLLQGASSATGNASTAGVCCGALQGIATQTINAGSAVTAETDVQGQGPTAQASADSTAIGSTQGFETSTADMAVGAVQNGSGKVAALTNVTVGGIDGEGGYTATSVVNDVTATSDSGVIGLTARQATDAGAPSSATLNVQQDGGDTVIAQATASGNNLNALGGANVVSVDSQQINGGDVAADTTAQLGSWNSASIGAYGVGNSINAEGGGGATLLTTSQTNTGAVSASATLNGGAGGESYVNATAVGNAVQGYACGDCGGGVSATTTQTNSGHVTSLGKIGGAAGGGAVTGASSAVGNTASFTVKSGG